MGQEVTRDYVLWALTYFAICATMFALSLCTLFTWCWNHHPSSTYFATACVYVHAFSGAFAVFMLTDMVYTSFYFPVNEWYAMIFILPISAYLLDVIVMQARIRLRFRYILSVSCFYILFISISVALRLATGECRSPNFSLPCPRNVGIVIGIELIFIVLLSIAAFVAIGLTRIPWPCYRSSH